VKNYLAAALVAIISSSLAFAGSNEVNDRVVAAAVVLKEVAGIPENGIPTDLLNKSVCVAVVPSMKKAGFIFGANYGKGVISCRTDSGKGPWSPPSMLMVGGGSFGLQLGAQATDLVLLVMNLSGMESLLDSKFTLGGDVSVAAGPVGRAAAAQTDAWMTAKILAYSRSRGLFGGISLKGDVVRPDNDANHVLYGGDTSSRSILLYRSAAPVPNDVKIFVDQLTQLSPKKD
jgi:SH3 domain-containing YSC84-like protein 1